MGKIIISEQKEYLSNHHCIKLKSKTEALTLMYCIPNMHKNPVRSRFIIALPKCTVKPLSKDVKAISKHFYRKTKST